MIFYIQCSKLMYIRSKFNFVQVKNMRMRGILDPETTNLFETKIVHDSNNHVNNSDWLFWVFFTWSLSRQNFDIFSAWLVISSLLVFHLTTMCHVASWSPNDLDLWPQFLKFCLLIKFEYSKSDFRSFFLGSWYLTCGFCSSP